MKLHKSFNMKRYNENLMVCGYRFSVAYFSKPLTHRQINEHEETNYVNE